MRWRGAVLVALTLASCSALKPNDVDDGGAVAPPGSGADAARDATTEATADVTRDAAADVSIAEAGPPSIRWSNVQLWLAADLNVACDAGRVTTWHDRSGHARDATPGAALGPRCGARTLGGLPVVTFTAPPSEAPYVDESLEVDLSFLLSAAYTIFIVERRALDRAVPDAWFLMGTQVSNEAAIKANCGGNSGITDTALQLGYFKQPVDGGFETYLFLDHTCIGLAGTAMVPRVDGSTPAPPSVVTARLDPSDNRYLYVNGVKKLAGAVPCTAGRCASSALLQATGGSIGRGLAKVLFDTRYLGDIAEVIAYDVSLGPADQASIESYLRAKWGF